MVKSWQKFLKKQNLRSKNRLDNIIDRIISWNYKNLDVIRKKWESNIFRCRVWKIRIIFFDDWDNIIIKEIWNRWNIYK